MAAVFVRAKCAATGAISALPKRSLDLGHIRGWVEVDGPVPSGPKSAAFPPKPAGEPPEETADSTSADTEEE